MHPTSSKVMPSKTLTILHSLYSSLPLLMASTPPGYIHISYGDLSHRIRLADLGFLAIEPGRLFLDTHLLAVDNCFATLNEAFEYLKVPPNARLILSHYTESISYGERPTDIPGYLEFAKTVEMLQDPVSITILPAAPPTAAPLHIEAPHAPPNTTATPLVTAPPHALAPHIRASHVATPPNAVPGLIAATTPSIG